MNRRARLAKVAVMPALYVIGPDGRILHGEFGYREKAEAGIAGVLKRP